MKTAIPCIVIALCLVLAPAAHGQIEDVIVAFQSGAELEGDVTACADGVMTLKYREYYGPAREYRKFVTRDIAFDTVRTVTFERGSGAGTTFLASTLIGTGIGVAFATDDGGPYRGLAVIFFGGLGVIVGGIAALIQSSASEDDRVFSPALPHDTRALSALLESGKVETDGPLPFAQQSVRESIPELFFELEDGRFCFAWLLDVRPDSLSILLSSNSYRNMDGSNEVRSFAVKDIAYVEDAVFPMKDDPYNDTWRPGEQSLDALRIYSFSHVSRAVNEQVQRREGN